MNAGQLAILNQIMMLLTQRLPEIHGVIVNVIEPVMTTLNPSIKVEIENQWLIAHLGFWSTKTAEIGAIRLDGAMPLFDYAFEFETKNDLEPHLDKVIELFKSE